jgi:outer membrane protein
MQRLGYFLATAALICATLADGGPARGQTLQEALANAYRTSSALESRRARLRATDEQVPQALGTMRPTLGTTFSFGYNDIESRDVSSTSGAPQLIDQTRNPRSGTLSLNQPIYRGGRTDAQVGRAESNVLAERARLFSVEQQVMLDSVTAFMNVVRDQALVALNRNNERVIARQLEATRDRFRVGEVTRTDVAQAEARLARATADRTQAEGNLTSSRATYARVIGAAPQEPLAPSTVNGLPGNENDLLGLAQDNNWTLLAARHDEQAARYNVDLIERELLPNANLTGTVSRLIEDQSTKSRRDSASIIGQLNIPIYQQGIVTSRTREAKQQLGERIQLLDDTKRSTIETATRAWETLQTTRARIRSLTAQVEASRIALEGVEQETNVGARTVLDLLDAEQAFLDSQVALVQAQRDEIVAAYQVRSAIGDLTAAKLGLPVELYDVDIHYRAVRNKWWGPNTPDGK